MKKQKQKKKTKKKKKNKELYHCRQMFIGKAQKGQHSSPLVLAQMRRL